MGTLRQEQFPLGWTPNSDERNGDPRGLLRADNLVFDPIGAVSLARGCVEVADYGSSSNVNAIYSRTLEGGNKLRYASVGGNVYRNNPSLDGTGSLKGVLSGGDPTNAAFGSGWGHTIIISGSQKQLDNGTTVQAVDLGIPTKVGVTKNNPDETVSPAHDNAWKMLEGDLEQGITANDGNYIKLPLDKSSFRGIAQNYDSAIAGDAFTWDATNLGGTGKDTPNDLFNMEVRIDLATIEKIRVELILTPQTTVIGKDATPSDYFFHEWYSDKVTDINPNYFDPDVFHFKDTAEFIQRIKDNLEPGISYVNYFIEGNDFWGSIQCLRSQFKRVGSNDDLSWKDIKCIRVTFQAYEYRDCYFWHMKFIGGQDGQLTGWYQYLQVNCYDSGNFIQRGSPGVVSDELQVIKASINVTPAAIGGNVNRVEIYRGSTQTPGYFLVKTFPKGSTPGVFEDTYSDIDAMRDNILLDYYSTVVPDGIRYIVGPTYQRLVYFDLKNMYVGQRNVPGYFDSRHQVTICSAGGEAILWATVVVDGTILVGTSHDIYTIRGDFAFDEATSLLNFTVEPMGIDQVPVSSAVASYGTLVFYMAEDGWRSVAGSNTQSVVPAISDLYNKYDRHGIPQVVCGSNNYTIFSCCVSRGQLICSVNEGNYDRALHIFDLEKKQWRYWTGTDTIRPGYLWAEEDGTVLFGGLSPGSLKLFQWDVGYTFGSSGMTFLMRTTYNANGAPTSRKDPLMFQITADSGNIDISIAIRAMYNDSSILVKALSTKFNGLETKFFELSGTTLGIPKWFQFEIQPLSGQVVSTWKFVGMSIDYVDHPPEINYLLIPPDNMGVAGRKRIPSQAFVIDTMGSPVDCTLVVDGVSKSTKQLLTGTKGVAFYHVVNTDDKPAGSGPDITGYARGFTLKAATGKLFELYDIIPHKMVEALPDPVQYLQINAFNYGTTKRKRLIQFGFIIDTVSSDVVFTPYIDGVAGTPATFNTNFKQTVIYYFMTNTLGIDVAGRLTGAAPFEFHGLDPETMVSETLPAAAKYLHVPVFNFGTTKRKRLIQFGMIINTKGKDVLFTPLVDNGAVVPATMTINTNSKQTVIYYFTDPTVGIDVGGSLSSIASGVPAKTTEFEFYGLDPETMVSEALPPTAEYFHIPYDNFGTSKRKRYIQYALVLDTRGYPVEFTPYVDGLQKTPTTFINSFKQTVIHYFVDETIGIDIGGTLVSKATPKQPFEFYGVAKDSSASEVLPNAEKILQTPTTNMGTPNKKRLRTIPIEIDTKGKDVSFVPTLDGVPYHPEKPMTINTNGKKTVFYMFDEDVFPVDIGGTFKSADGTTPFEFYGYTGNVIVEKLPVARIYDQVGPIDFNRQARVYGFRLQCINEGTALDYKVFGEDYIKITGSLVTVPNHDQTLEVNFPKGLKITVFRMEFSSQTVFHRLKFYLKVDVTGAGTDNKWVNL